MVVYTASIVSKNGAILLSRQFLDISKNMLDQYLNSFICRLDSDSQHTFIDDKNIRYVYQPMGLLYMVILTSGNSNIFEDLEIVRTFARIVNHYCYPINEQTIRNQAFTLFYAFDELVSLGYKENITLDDINKTIEMHSENEILAEIVKKDRENQAKETMKRKAKEFELMQKLQHQREKSTRTNNHGGLFSSPLASLANQLISNLKGSSSISSVPSYMDSTMNNSTIHPSKMLYSGDVSSQKSTQSSNLTSQTYAKTVKSLNLSKQKDTNSQLFKTFTPVESSKSQQKLVTPQSNISTKDHKVIINLNEHISVIMNRDGQLEKYELTGVMIVNISDNDLSNIKIQFSNTPNSKLIVQTHPNIDKKIFSNSNLLCIKDGGRNYPLNNDIGVLKWRYQSNNLDDLILSFNSWVDKTSDYGLSIVIDLELNNLNFTLDDICVMFPLSPHFHGNPNVLNITDGRYQFNKNMFTWELSIIDKNSKNASIEISIDGYNDSIDSIYPIKCKFGSRQLLLESHITSVIHNSDVLASKEYLLDTSLNTNVYDII